MLTTLRFACLQTAVKACAQGGKVVTVGMGVDEVRFPNTLATVKEVDIIGSFRYANTVRPLRLCYAAEWIALWLCTAYCGYVLLCTAHCGYVLCYVAEWIALWLCTAHFVKPAPQNSPLA
jgi:hypothetical protein